MLKDKQGLEVQLKEKTFQFFWNDQASLGEIFDALHVLRSHVLKAMTKQQEEDATKVESKLEGEDGAS